MVVNNKYYYDLESYILCKTGDIDAFATKWSDILTDSKVAGLASFTGINSDAYATKLLTDYLQPRYWNSIVKISDTDYTADGTILLENLTADEKKELFSAVDLKLWLVLVQSFERYKYLLGLYSDKLALLYDDGNKTVYTNLADVSSGSTKTKHNDSPQNGGDFDDDAHTSDISNSTIGNTNTRNGTINITSAGYEKIDKIQNTIKSLYEKWADEFVKCFYDMGE